MTDALFDAERYGPAPPPKRKRRPRPAEVRLYRPWVLVGTRRGMPTAHLLNPQSRDHANQLGAILTACDRHGYIIQLDGHPLAKVCATCWDINERNQR